MRIDSSGNVGIGTSSPSQPLTVKASAASNIAIRILNSSNNQGGIQFTDDPVTTGQASITSSTSNNLIFGTNAAERMRIDSSGNLLVNTTSTLGTTWINLNGVTSTKNGIGIKNGTDTGTIYSLFVYNSSSSLIGSINNNGSATSFTTSSDYRLKENIAPMTGALEKVAQLKPVTYKWKSTGEESQGFIAHELAEVCPDAVTGEKDAVDKEGNPKYQGVDTSFLVATLAAAIQELKAELDVVKATVEAQAARIAELEGAK
jgi:hypothetical protein